LLCASPPISNILLPESGQVAVGATSVITTRVKAGSDLWFAQWQGRIGAAQQQFPGYVGQRVQAPIPGVNPNWVAIVAFDTAENLRSWDDSAERKALVAESSPYIERYDSRPANSAFESWFASSENGAKPPPAWKLTSIVLLVLYPVVMLEILTINKFMAEMHLAAAISTFIGNAISVALTGLLLIPWASRALRWWLVPPEASARKRTALGAGLIIALYALCVLIFALLINWDPALL
jgi:antibiotic biosynthesis monooxygenase (ABM) superfamily enzyme